MQGEENHGRSCASILGSALLRVVGRPKERVGSLGMWRESRRRPAVGPELGSAPLLGPSRFKGARFRSQTDLQAAQNSAVPAPIGSPRPPARRRHPPTSRRRRRPRPRRCRLLQVSDLLRLLDAAVPHLLRAHHARAHLLRQPERG